MTEISAESITLMIDEESGGEAYYQRTEEHWDWPGGSSGPTVGEGYDCGYVTKEECHADWTGIVDDDTIAELQRAVGRTGASAHVFVLDDRLGVTITWAQAVRQFKEREIPKWIRRCELALPNFDLLPPDCAGALVSLAYNRGTGGFHSSIPRYREMNNIYHLMVDQNFAAIPEQIRNMRRLWPVDGDLWRRREHEANLFEHGLNSGPEQTGSETIGV